MSEDNGTHLKANDPSTWKKGEDETWGDRFLHPLRPLNQRQRELCRLAAHGKTNNEIAAALSYTASRVSILLTNRKIKDEIESYRDRLFATDTQTRLKEMSTEALDAMADILSSQSIPAEDKESAAKWVLEKTTGKPAQQVNVTAEVNIGHLLDKLDNMPQAPKLVRPAAIDIIPHDTENTEETDVEATKAPAGPAFADWLDKNL